MLSKEATDYFFRVIDKFAVDAGEALAVSELKKLVELGLSVQEGLKDAREAFEDFVTPNGYSIETDPDGEYACPEVRLQKSAFMAGARHNAAFALKQKGEVVAEFDATVEYQPIGASKIIIPWEDGLDEDLRYKDVHVTLSLPQQEQE